MENDDMYFEYLVSIGAMRPEEAQMARKQAQVDAMRDRSMTSPEGQMVGKHYVAPSFTQYAGQLMNAYGTRKGQEALDEQYGSFNQKQKAMLEALRADKRLRRQMDANAPTSKQIQGMLVKPVIPGLDEEEE
jgi:hypothetical protein